MALSLLGPTGTGLWVWGEQPGRSLAGCLAVLLACGWAGLGAARGAGCGLMLSYLVVVRGTPWGGVLRDALVGRVPGAIVDYLSIQISATDKKPLDVRFNLT